MTHTPNPDAVSARISDEQVANLIDIFRRAGDWPDTVTALTELQQHRAQASPVRTAPGEPRHGIYMASKVVHAQRWRLLRKVGFPIISSWIDEAEAGQSQDLADLWRRCIAEASSAEVLVFNAQHGELFKGAWIELGAALASGVPVFAVGLSDIEGLTVAHDKRIRHFAKISDVMEVLKPMCNGVPFRSIDSEDIRAALSASRERPEGVSFQQRVQPWMMATFGPEISADKIERNHRFIEEALELVQANGCTQSEAHQLVDYVYGRDEGEINQEVGGVMVTLAALCLAIGEDMHAAGEKELARVWTKIDKIRAKQAAKPKHSPLPEAAPVSALDPAPTGLVGEATHRHKKRGTEYVLIGIGKMQAQLWFDGLDEDGDTTVDNREVAIYRSVDDGSLWVRPLEEFNDGRFEDLRAALAGAR